MIFVLFSFSGRDSWKLTEEDTSKKIIHKTVIKKRNLKNSHPHLDFNLRFSCRRKTMVTCFPYFRLRAGVVSLRESVANERCRRLQRLNDCSAATEVEYDIIGFSRNQCDTFGCGNASRERSDSAARASGETEFMIPLVTEQV